MSEFKVGDKVMVVKNSSDAVNNHGEYFDVGDCGIIQEFSEYDTVRISNSASSWISLEDVALVKGKNIEVPSMNSIPLADNNMVVDQKHYTNNAIQPIEIMKANFTIDEYRGFLLGNIVKYPLRYKDKNGLRDLKTTYTYLTWLIQDIEERGL